VTIAAYALAIVPLAVGFGAPRTAVLDHAVVTEQCLRFEQPLGYSASGAREQGDSAWYVLQLGDSGAVTRPLFPKRQRERWSKGSHWAATAFTLVVSVSDGLVGWDLTLWPDGTGTGFAGTATYRTDVVVAGWVPPQMKVHATKIKCPAVPA